MHTVQANRVHPLVLAYLHGGAPQAGPSMCHSRRAGVSSSRVSTTAASQGSSTNRPQVMLKPCHSRRTRLQAPGRV